MEYIVIILICMIFLILLKFSWDIKLKDIKKLKELGYDKELKEITNKLPENKEICRAILKKLNNNKVTIKESQTNTASFYLVLNDTILIANNKETFTRLQTIAHECLHSIQNRKTLLFNFFYSNIYLLYFFGLCILSILGLNQHGMIHLFILTIGGFAYYAIRSYLEMDAMTKAKPLAKEYMEEGTLTQEEQNTILANYELLNTIGIKLSNYKFLVDCTTKIIIYAVIMIIIHLL